jgi:hypothetical protein
MTKIVKVIERNEFDSVVDVQITVRTVIREGRDMPDMTFNGEQITDCDFIDAVLAELDSDPIAEEEMERICG